MLKISAIYLIGKAEIPIHYTTMSQVEQALLEIYCDNWQLMLILLCKGRSACSIGSTQKRVPVLREFGIYLERIALFQIA